MSTSSSSSTRKQQDPAVERSSFTSIQDGIAALSGSVKRESSRVSESSDLVNEVEKAFNAADRQEMLKWTVMIIGAFTILKMMVSAFSQILLGALPALFFYLRHTCPDQASFDKRKELKRVLRGKYLADDHPDKPKGYFEKMVAKASASLTAETAMLSGAELDFTSYQGAFIVVELRVPSCSTKLYWIGIAGSWRHMYSKPMGGQ